MSDITSC